MIKFSFSSPEIEVSLTHTVVSVKRSNLEVYINESPWGERTQAVTLCLCCHFQPTCCSALPQVEDTWWHKWLFAFSKENQSHLTFCLSCIWHNRYIFLLIKKNRITGVSIERHSHLYISYTGSDFLMIKACFCVCSCIQNLNPFWHHSNVNKLRSPWAVAHAWRWLLSYRDWRLHVLLEPWHSWPSLPSLIASCTSPQRSHWKSPPVSTWGIRSHPLNLSSFSLVSLAGSPKNSQSGRKGNKAMVHAALK